MLNSSTVNSNFFFACHSQGVGLLKLPTTYTCVYNVRTGGTMTTDTTLNVRIAEDVKIKASKILQASGLTTSVAVRMFLMRVIEDEALPFDPTRPNKKTLNAIKASKAGKTTRAKNSKALIKQLNARN